MNIDANQAQDLCASIAAALGQQGDSLRASLQCAGVERKIEGWIQSALTEWLRVNAAHLNGQDLDLICFSEYRGIDFVFARRESVGANAIVVETLFEVKFNYTSQAGELANRPARAAAQVHNYLNHHEIRDGYVIYITAVPHHPRQIDINSDMGWRYTQNGNVPIAQAQAILENSAAEVGLHILARNVAEVQDWRYGVQLFKLQD